MTVLPGQRLGARSAGTWLTAEELCSAGLPVEVVEAVIALTRRAADTYEEYIERAARNDRV